MLTVGAVSVVLEAAMGSVLAMVRGLDINRGTLVCWQLFAKQTEYNRIEVIVDDAVPNLEIVEEMKSHTSTMIAFNDDCKFDDDWHFSRSK